MKNLTKLIIIIAILGLSSQSHAQYIALKGGLNLSNMLDKDNDKTYSSDYSNRAGYHVGLIAGIRTGFIGVEGGLLISSKGYNFEYTEVLGDTVNFSGNRNLVYLDVPINLKLSAGLGGNRLFATVGPVFGFGLTGKTTMEETINNETPTETEEKIKWGSSADDHLLSMDIGLGLGGGIEIGNITFSASYNWGLVNLAPNTDNGEEIKNNVLQFSLAFKLLGR